MRLKLNSRLAAGYANQSQRIRVLTESWVSHEAFCPSCGFSLKSYPNNKPVADFYCSHCTEEYELKSKNGSMNNKILGGAYSSMMRRLTSEDNPNLFLLSYDRQNNQVVNLVIVPKHFFTPEIIEKRKPLSDTARRAGWVGCNILISQIPNSGKIFLVENKKSKQKQEVLENWKKVLFLKDAKGVEPKGWLLDVMLCVDMLGQERFTLPEMYQFEKLLAAKHSGNKNIRAKIRQQLQLLRDREYLEFTARGSYRLK